MKYSIPPLRLRLLGLFLVLVLGVGCPCVRSAVNASPAPDAQATWEHVARSPNCSIAKAERLLGYRPRYTSLQAVQEAVAWLMEKGRLG